MKFILTLLLILLGVLMGLLLVLPVMMFLGWIVMLISGVIGSIFEVDNFFISYWQSVLLTLCLTALFSIFGSIK